MRLVFTLGRYFSFVEAPLRPGSTSKLLRNTSYSRANAHTFPFHTNPRFRPPSWRTRRPKPGALLAAGGAGMAASAFIELSEDGSASHGDTGEKRMLQISRAEIRKTAGENDGTLGWLHRRIVVFLDLFIWEPVCTCVRFFQLAVIFIPVMVTVPVIWFGTRCPERDNERIGSLWWYGFLVHSMEWAGPAFIKVTSTTPSLLQG